MLIEHHQGLVKRHLRLRSTFLGYSKLSKELARRFHLAEAKKKCKLAVRKCFAREEPLQHVARLLNHRGRLAQARQRMPHVVGLENLNARSILQYASGERQVRFMRGAFWNSFVDGWRARTSGLSMLSSCMQWSKRTWRAASSLISARSLAAGAAAGDAAKLSSAIAAREEPPVVSLFVAALKCQCTWRLGDLPPKSLKMLTETMHTATGPSFPLASQL